MPNLRDILSLIFKRKEVVTAFFLSVVLFAFLGLKLVAPTYTATSKILVKIGREDIYMPSITSEAVVSPLMSIVREEQLNSEVQILTSDNLAEKLVTEMSPDALYPGMFVRHRWYTPKGVMQGMIGLYKGLENFFVPLSANPSKQQRALKRFLRKDLHVKGTGDSNVVEVTVRSKIPALAAQVSNRLVDLYLTERSRIHSDSEGQIFEKQMQDIEQRLEEAQNALQDYREISGLVDVTDERDAMLKRAAEIRSMIVDLQARPAEAQRLAKWQTELDDVEYGLSVLGDQELEYVRLVQDVDVLKRSRQLYLEKLEEYRINRALATARIGNVSVISRAIPPSAPVSPKLWLVLLAVAVVGLGGGIGLAFLVEFLDDTVETDSDVRKYLGVPVLGKIGQITAAAA